MGALYIQNGRILWGKYQDENLNYVVGKAALTHPRGAYVTVANDCLILQNPGFNTRNSRESF